MVDCNVDNCNFIFIITLCKCMHVKFVKNRCTYKRSNSFFLSIRYIKCFIMKLKKISIEILKILNNNILLLDCEYLCKLIFLKILT